jgi:hypothetical protein
MGIFGAHKRKALWIGPLLVALMVAGCACIKPYEPRDYREEGPERGLFTGSKGEWVIIGPKAPQTGEGETKNAVQGSEADREEKKHPEKPANGE